ncbi:MAG: ribosomal protein S18-alanine N-acetyltransferase [Syntrophomonadaceae bacterium]|nr:ribosomal protein S18-alanine N-acetyltransferase [Syntrophomonadaceae bacterium]
MEPDDIHQVMFIEMDSFTLPWSRESYLSELRNPFANYLVCECQGLVAGYAGIWVVFEEAHITNIAVASKFRGRGFGSALMMELEQIARKKKANRILLEVRPTNSIASNMYRVLGYIPTGLRKAYYSDNGEDAVVMTKFLF